MIMKGNDSSSGPRLREAQVWCGASETGRQDTKITTVRTDSAAYQATYNGAAQIAGRPVEYRFFEMEEPRNHENSSG
jgi:hypothetical protein